jgi:hypothetical protein
VIRVEVVVMVERLAVAVARVKMRPVRIVRMVYRLCP